jgi:hypothetical protein
VPPVNVNAGENVDHVDPDRYCTYTVPEDGTGSIVAVTPVVPPHGIDAASGVPVTVGGTTVTVNGSDV